MKNLSRSLIWSLTVAIFVGAAFFINSIGGQAKSLAGDESSNRGTFQTKLVGTGSQEGSQVGISVAVNGDTAIIGAFGDFNGSTRSGAAYVFVKSGGVWTQQQKLVPNDGETLDQFGISVAVNGDTAIVGANRDDVGTNSNQGSVYVFTRSGATWIQSQKIVAPDGTIDAQFGYSVAMTGDSAVISAVSDSTGGNTYQGSAYVYIKNGATWTQQQKITASDGAANDFFGVAAIDGDTIVIGVKNDAIGANNNFQGSAYIFTRSGTTWTERQKLLASDGVGGDLFGNAVAIRGNTLVVGASYDDVNGIPNQGSAYIFTRSGTTWTEQQRLTQADNSSGGNQFGNSVAVSGDTVIVGAFEEDLIQFGNEGAVYVYTKNGATWAQNVKLTAVDHAAGDHFGFSVAFDGNALFVGARDDDAGAGMGQGSAYIFDFANHSTPFDFDGNGTSDVSLFRASTGTWFTSNNPANNYGAINFGASSDKITPADFDGDGKTDVAVYRPSAGTWYLQRSSLGFTGTAFGAPEDIPVPADYDNDGKADLAVFRPSNGTWYILGSTAGFYGTPFGASTDKPVVADYDGDGKADIAVYRPSNGTWYLQRSQAGFAAVTFGASEDKPVPADYDGDGKADVAVFRPSNGYWYLQQSTLGFSGTPFGLGTDLPVPADYDGDGKSDVAVFRVSNGTWYLNRSTQGFTGVAFGANGDKPTPNAFIQ